MSDMRLPVELRNAMGCLEYANLMVVLAQDFLNKYQSNVLGTFSIKEIEKEIKRLEGLLE